MKSNVFNWQSLKTRVTLFTLGILAISIWAMAFYTSRTLQADMQHLLGDQQFSTTKLVAQGVDEELNARITALGDYAKGIITPSILSNVQALQERLEGSPAILSMFNGGVFLTGADGVAIASVPVSAGRVGTNYMDRDVMVAAIKEGRPSIGKPVLGKLLLSPVVVIAVPVRNNQGNVIGALAGVTDLGKPNFLDKITESHYGKSGGYLVIAPQHKLFVTATDKSLVMQPVPAPGIDPMFDQYMQGHEGFGVSVNSRGVSELSAAKSIPAAGWFVVATLPTQEAFAPIDTLTQRVLLSTLVFSLLAGTLTWWLISRMLQQRLAPMLTASRALSTFTADDRSIPPLPATSQDEIGELFGGFNNLLEALKEREDTLKESEAFKNAILNSLDAEIAVVNQHGVILAVNNRWQQFALENSLETDKPAPRTSVGINYLACCEDTASTGLDARSGIQAVLDGRLSSFTLEYPCHSACQQRWFSMTVMPLSQEAKAGAVITHTNISQRKQMEDALHEQEEFFRLIADNLEGFVVVLDTEGRRIYNSPSYARLLKGRKLSGTSSFSDIHPADRERVISAFQKLVATGIGQHLEYQFVMADGEICLLESRSGVIKDHEGQTKYVVVVSHDVTERRRVEEKIHHLAFNDALTQLPNRLMLSDRLHQAMAASKRSGCYGALMFLDLDNFKPVNDMHGHDVGDLLLIEAAERLRSCMREMDTVARFGGDEFVALLSGLHACKVESTAQALRIAEKIRLTLSEPYHLILIREGAAEKKIEHRCTSSIGVALFLDHEVSENDLLKWADAAMYQAKEAGGNLIRLYDTASASGIRTEG